MRCRLVGPAIAAALSAALLLSATEAAADTVAVLPSRGGDEGGARSTLDIELVRALGALGHRVVDEADTKRALAAGVADGVADTNEEYQAIGAGTKADWVLVATIEPAVVTQRVELTAMLVSQRRVESVAREVEKARSLVETQEMLTVLLRPEGIGAGALPWEKQTKPKAARPVAQPVAVTPPPVKPSGKKLVHMDYMFTREDVWPAYAANRRIFVTAAQGFSVAASTPGTAGADSSSNAIVGHIRAGYALGDDGLEVFANLGGNLFGPRALWIEAGGRWMWTPSLHIQPPSGDYYALSFHVGPELTLGPLIRLPTKVVAETATYEGSTEAFFTLGAALDMVLAITPMIRVEAQVGNFRWVPTGEGSLVLFGATLGGQIRF